MTSWHSFVVSNCELVTFPLVSWVRCGTWLYRFLIFAPLLTLVILHAGLYRMFFRLQCCFFLSKSIHFTKKFRVSNSLYLDQRMQSLSTDDDNTDLILLDFSKTFDQVNHLKLLKTFMFWCKRKHFKLHSVIPDRSHSNCCTGCGVIWGGQSDLWCTSGLSTRSAPLSIVHQWPTWKHSVPGQVICWWHCCIPDSHQHAR